MEAMMARPEQSVTPSTGTKELVEAVQQIAQSVVAVQQEVLNAVREARADVGAAAMFGSGAVRSQASNIMRSTNWSTAADGLILPLNSTPAPANPEPLASTPSVPKGRARGASGGEGSPKKPRTIKPRDTGKTPVVDNKELGQPIQYDEEQAEPPFTREGSEEEDAYERKFKVPSTFKAGRAARRDGTLRSLRKDFYHDISRQISTMGANPYQEVEVPDSTPVKKGDVLDHILPGADGEGMKKVWRDSKTLQVVEEEAAQKALRRTARADAVRRGVASMAEGGTLSEGVAAAVPALGKAMGVAGIGFEVGKRLYDFGMEQNAANRPYQQVLGGNLSEGFGERFRKRLFRLQSGMNLNPLSGGEADKLFDGAMRIYAQDQGMRRQAERVGIDLYRSTGMDVQEILRTFQVAARAGTESLKEIGMAFKEVTKDARAAGMNAEEARKRFATTYESISKSVSGPQGILMAQAQTSALTAMGHRFEGMTLQNGMTADLYTGLYTGQTPGEVWAMQNTNADGARRSEAAQQQRRIDTVNNLFGKDRIASIMSRYGAVPGQKLTPEMQQKMANDLMRETGFDPSMVADALGKMGGMEGLNRNNAPLAAIQVATGQIDTLGELDKKIGDLKPQNQPFEVANITKSAGGYTDMIGGDSIPGYTERYKFLTDKLGMSQEQARLAVQAATSTDGADTGKGQAGAANRLLRLMEKTGKTDPVLEYLVKNYDNDRRYRVRTKDGDKIVGNYELINNFADQAATGRVEITKGQNAGVTIAEAMGVDETILPGYGVEPESANQEYKGKKFSDDGDKSPTGTIIVKAAPDLQRWISFQSTGGSSVRTETYGVPQSGIVAADQRPTG